MNVVAYKGLIVFPYADHHNFGRHLADLSRKAEDGKTDIWDCLAGGITVIDIDHEDRIQPVVNWLNAMNYPDMLATLEGIVLRNLPAEWVFGDTPMTGILNEAASDQRIAAEILLASG